MACKGRKWLGGEKTSFPHIYKNQHIISTCEQFLPYRAPKIKKAQARCFYPTVELV